MSHVLDGRTDVSVVTRKLKRGTPLYEQTYDALWKLIFNGEILPGQRLSDRKWATRLDTSRTPVREAMRQMARDGILLVLENGGYQVRPADPQGLADLYNCRAPLAALAVHESTKAGSDRLFDQIRTVAEAIGRAIVERNAGSVLKLNSKFHSLVVENCGNPYLIIMMSNIERLILFYRIALLKTSSVDREHSESYFEHLARGNERQLKIADAMAKRAAKQAARLMERHLLDSAQDMAKLLRSL